jgi:hypothetical protein
MLLAIAILLSAIVVAGCASTAAPNYDDDGASEPRCPRDYTMKCIKRTAAPDECSCVPDGDVRQTIESVIGIT